MKIQGSCGASGAGPETCPLGRAALGVSVRIRSLCGPPEVANRLREVGLGEDQVIRLVAAGASLICQVCNSRLAISRDLAATILVSVAVS